MAKQKYHGSILMLSTHGYVSAEPELGKPDTGGQVVFVLEEAKRFSRLGYRVHLVTRRFEKQPAVDRINKGLCIWRIPFGGREFIRKEDMHDYIGDFITNFLSEVQHRRIEYDVVYSHYWDAGWAGQRIAEELQIPHIHTPHSLGAWKREQMKDSPDADKEMYRFDERIRKEFLIYRNCDHIVATSYQQEELLKAQYGIPEDHVTMIPPGIDEGKYTPVPPNEITQLRKQYGLKDKDIYAVGRAAANKGYDLLIRALPHLKKLQPDARLVLAAGANSGPDRERVKSWQELGKDLGVDDSIVWRGYVPDEEMADMYRCAAVFALCSRYEPFGMTAVEAMACGTPTVMTVHGGLYEVVDFGHHALYADPLRPEEFAAILNIPLQYPQLGEKLSIEGARFARRQFGWTGIAKRKLTVFDKFIGTYDPLADTQFEDNPGKDNEPDEENLP